MNAMDDLRGIVVKQFEGVNYTPEMVKAMKSLMSQGPHGASSLISMLDAVHEFIQDSDFLEEDPDEILNLLRRLSAVRRELKPFRDGTYIQPGEMVFGEEVEIKYYGECLDRVQVHPDDMMQERAITESEELSKPKTKTKKDERTD